MSDFVTVKDSGFTKFRFEAKCDTGIGALGIPHLDLLAEGVSALGIESKCTEHLTKHTPDFSPSYRLIKDERRNSTWFELMEKLMPPAGSRETRRRQRAGTGGYCYLDAAQLIKHAFGLAHCFPSSTLLYLYWEPRNASEFDEFKAHREEVARFAEEVKGSQP